MVITVEKYTEDMPVVMQARIATIIDKMQQATGMEKIKLIADYKLRAELYNGIVGFTAYDVNYTGG